MSPPPAAADRIAADWIAVDWGTSRLRAWAMAPDGAALAYARADAGMATLTPEGYEPALMALIGGWLGPDGATPVVVCGMAGAREGWSPAPYADPGAPLDRIADAPATPRTGPRLAVRILPGLRQDAPPEVMRGEETQIAGLARLRPGFEGVVALPGTHSKWAQVEGGRVTAFRTMMTGELFALMATRSVLRHAMPQDPAAPDEAAFDAAVAQALAEPAAAPAALFSVRAGHVLGRAGAAAAAGRLSGLLIGAELAAAAALFPQGPVALIGDGALVARYARALAVAGRQATAIDPDAATLAGLSAAHALLFGARRHA